MISVLNPQRLLNGNKFISLFILFILVISSTGCFTSKSSTGAKTPPKAEKPMDDDPVVYNPVTKKYEKQSQKQKEAKEAQAKHKADSIAMAKKEPAKVEKKEEKAVIAPSNLRTSVKKSVYNVVYLLPFMTSKGSYEITNNSAWAIDFYSGAKIALEEINTRDALVNVHVIDSDVSDEEIERQLRRSEVLNADLIIGPYKSSQAKIISEFVKGKEITVVSPYTASSKASSDNANYIQVTPSIGEHYEAIANHLSKHYKSHQIYYITRDNETERNRTQTIHQIYNNLTDSPKTKPKEIILPDEFNLSGRFSFDSLMAENSPTVFVVPSWDENFVQDLMRKMDRDKKDNDIVVYGMPQWQNFERCFAFYDRMKVTISSHVLVEPQSRQVADFKAKYFDIYSKMPGVDCFLGYDITKYFISRMINYGNFFQASINKEEQQGIVANFKIQPNISEDKGVKLIDFYENKGIQILQFKGLNFKAYD